MQNKPLLLLTPAAQAHFCALLAKEAGDANDRQILNLRIVVVNPSTSKADVGISFCPERGSGRD